MYTICRHCDHFVEENYSAGEGYAEFVHLDNGTKEHDHDAKPAPRGSLPVETWKVIRPDLFWPHRDGEVGPNSRYHVPRG